MLMVDTRVVIDVLEDDSDWVDWSMCALRTQAEIQRLAINPVIYAELSLTFSTVEALDSVVEDMQLSMLDIPRPALFLAGKAFVRYRRQEATGAMCPTTFSSAHMPRSRAARY